eukprot:1160119-Pelagomonas_calceolata.AAC.6
MESPPNLNQHQMFLPLQHKNAQHASLSGAMLAPLFPDAALEQQKHAKGLGLLLSTCAHLFNQCDSLVDARMMDGAVGNGGHIVGALLEQACKKEQCKFPKKQN